jgi:hypothetical protein
MGLLFSVSFLLDLFQYFPIITTHSQDDASMAVPHFAVSWTQNPQGARICCGAKKHSGAAHLTWPNPGPRVSVRALLEGINSILFRSCQHTIESYVCVYIFICIYIYTDRYLSISIKKYKYIYLSIYLSIYYIWIGGASRLVKDYTPLINRISPFIFGLKWMLYGL